MKKSKIVILIFAFVLLLFDESVFAQSNSYYENSNGVIVTEKEYQFINDFYGNGYFENMSLDDYNWISDLNINENDIEIKTIYDSNPLSRGATHTTAKKKLAIAKSCDSNCLIIVNCKWLTNPVVRSFDVIGARLSDTSLASDVITTKVTSSEGTEYFSNLQTLSGGFGVSVKLPSSGTGISVEQKFIVSKSGIVYAAYQHATSNISLANSKLYTINSSGYGGVFQFYGRASGVYDQMNGVSISL